MTAAGRPLPEPTADSEPFWEGCARGEFLLCRCRACGGISWFPRAMCPSCGSVDREWVPASGRGAVHAFSVVHRAPGPGFDAPYVLALVDLEEGPRVMSHVVDCDPDDVRVGMAVTVRFEALSPEIALPVFSPPSRDG